MVLADVEIQKVDDMTEQHTIYQIAHCSAYNQTQGYGCQFLSYEVNG